MYSCSVDASRFTSVSSFFHSSHSPPVYPMVSVVMNPSKISPSIILPALSPQTLVSVMTMIEGRWLITISKILLLKSRFKAPLQFHISIFILTNYPRGTSTGLGFKMAASTMLQPILCKRSLPIARGPCPLPTLVSKPSCT